MGKQGLTTGRRQGGFTLVEVLVALAILAVGVYASLAIFPTGFATVAYNRSLTMAARLAEGELQRWKTRAASLPEAIVSRDPDTGVVGTDYDPDRLYFEAPNRNWQPDATWLPRTIIGETVVVPHPPDVGTAPAYQVPLYVLTMSPLDAAHPDLVVYSTPYHEVDDPHQLDPAADHYQFCANYDQGYLDFDESALDRHFRIEYAWYQVLRDGGGNITGQAIRHVVNDPDPGTGSPPRLISAGGPNRITLSCALDAGGGPHPDFAGVVHDSIRVYQAFHWVTDPAELPLDSGEFYAPTSALVTGVLQFADADAGRTVKVDYQVADWQILRQEQILGREGIIRAEAMPIRQATDFTPPRTTAGLPLDSVGGTAIDIVAVNVSTGEALYGSDQVTVINPPDAHGYRGTFAVDYLNGNCTFSSGGVGSNRVGGTWRLMYRSLDDWTMQVLKAAEYYLASDTGAPARGDQLYTLAPPDPTNPNPALRYYVYKLAFPESERGKMVSVDYSYTRSGVPGRTTVNDALFRLEPESVGGAPRGVVLLPPQLNYAGSPLSSLTISSVRGVSLRARAIWVGRGLTRTETPGQGHHLPPQGEEINERMHHQDVESYVVRSQ